MTDVNRRLNLCNACEEHKEQGFYDGQHNEQMPEVVLTTEQADVLNLALFNGFTPEGNADSMMGRAHDYLDNLDEVKPLPKQELNAWEAMSVNQRAFIENKMGHYYQIAKVIIPLTNSLAIT